MVSEKVMAGSFSLKEGIRLNYRLRPIECNLRKFLLLYMCDWIRLGHCTVASPVYIVRTWTLVTQLSWSQWRKFIIQYCPDVVDEDWRS